MALNSAKMRPPSRDMHFDDLPDPLLAQLFACVPARHRRRLPLVCRRWRAVCDAHPITWQEVYLDFPKIEANGKLYKWCVERRAGIQRLKVVTNTEDDWLAVHLVLGVLAASLQRLTVRGRGSGVGMQSVAWLSILSRLKALDLQYDDTDIIENCAVLPVGLEELTLRCWKWNRVGWLPPSLPRLADLRRLRVHGLALPLTEVLGADTLLYLTSLTKLEHLELKSGHINALPAGFTALRALTGLSLLYTSVLADNGLRPLAGLTALRELDLSESAVTSLRFVTNMTGLRRLAVPGNDISVLPEGRYLQSLQYLDISCNSLLDLPSQLTECTGLEVLRMDNNPFPAGDDTPLMLAHGPAFLRQLMTGNPYLREVTISKGSLLKLSHAQLRTSFPQVLLTEVGKRGEGTLRDHVENNQYSSSDDGGSSSSSSSDGMSDWGSDADHTGSDEEEWSSEEDAGEADLEGGEEDAGEADLEGGEEDDEADGEAGSEGDDLGGDHDARAEMDAINGRPARRAMGTAGRPAPLLTLPDSLLVHLFNLLAPAERQNIIPLVCRRLRVLANTASSLWEQVHLALPHDFQQTISTAHLYQFFVRREGAVRSLHVEMSSGAAWPTVVAVLGVVGRSLHDLRIAGDTQECQVPGCTAPWLELVPNLLSLELDEAVDHSIAEARFPQSLTRLELSYCGDEGLYTVPANLERCTQLHTLALQSAMFDNELTLDRLAACKTIEHLDLSNCCLARVPPVLARLPRLTSLTLNENDGLGAAAALAPLSLLTGLKTLEMRECRLPAVPASVTALTSLQCLLLGYNHMTERPPIPAGPYLAGLRVLAMSDARGLQDDQPFDLLVEPLAAAGRLEVLRINRCMGLQLSIEDVGALLEGKPHFRKLEFTADMLSDPEDLVQLRRRFPRVTFKAVE
ncbi:Ras suppressor protein 1 [Chlorella vulgaris]